MRQWHSHATTQQIVPRTRLRKKRVLLALGWNSTRFLSSIGQYALEAGWHLETRPFFSEAVPDGWHGEGLLISHTMNRDFQEFMRRQAPLQPTVLIGGNPIGLRLPQVREDNRAAGALGARHFIERGYKHFAWITPHVASHMAPVAVDRLEGFRAGLQDAGFQCHILEAPAEFRRQQSWLVEKLRKMPRPLAVFALDDQVASETIETCLAGGWRIPEDIAILGVGNIEIACKCSHVPISSVDINEEDVGRRAAILLDKLMHGGKPPPHATVIAPRGVIARQSTDSLILTNPASRAAVAFIKANLDRALSLEQVAEAAGISRRTLYRLFEHDLRLTPADFILQARLEKARRELSIPGKKIAAVAAQYGFGSASTLTRHFRKYEGMTTEAWQKANAIIRVQ